MNLSADMIEFEAALAEFLDSKVPQLLDSELGSVMSEMIRYACFPAGKRIRPSLIVTICNDCKNSEASALSVAIAVELLHSASLVHDDLPALDNDDLRRGRPSLHRQFGEANAILAGDAMAALAISSVVDDSSLSSELRSQLASELSSVYAKVCLGQVLDLSYAHQAKYLEEIHHLKTAALFETSLRCGAMVGGASSEKLILFGKLGRCFGELFQALDDLQDFSSGEGSSTELEQIRVLVKDKAHLVEEILSDPSLGLPRTAMIVREFVEQAKLLLKKSECLAAIL